MISFLIEDTKECMHKLLKDTTFDDFLCVGFELTTLYKITLDGQIRHEFLSLDEKEILEGRTYIEWKDFKDQAYSLIKGQKAPSQMRIVFALKKTAIEAMVQRIKFSTPEAIGGFTFIINYENKRMKVVTGTNYATFTLDKAAEQYFDDNMQKFFKKHNIATLLALD